MIMLLVATSLADLYSCDFYLWGTLKERVYANNTHTLKELKENICIEIFNITEQQLCCVARNIFQRCEATS